MRVLLAAMMLCVLPLTSCGVPALAQDAAGEVLTSAALNPPDIFPRGGVRRELAKPFCCRIERAARAAYAGAIAQAASAAGVPLALAHAVVTVESRYRPGLRGRAGEWGLGQIKCQTARGVGFAGACHQLAEPATNLRYAMRYLRLALDRGRDTCSGVSLYQRGVHARPVCTAYGRKVLAVRS